jgi:regulation of enolase protein 1 (concanavalin A-like superfamily)
MLAFTPDDAFVLTAKVTPDFKTEFDGGFLVVYGDPTHWAKLLLEKSHDGPISVGSSVTNTIDRAA